MPLLTRRYINKYAEVHIVLMYGSMVTYIYYVYTYAYMIIHACMRVYLFLSPGLWCRGFTPYTARLCAPDSCGGQKVACSHGKREPKMEEASLCNCTPEYRQAYQEGSRRSTRN